MWTQGWGCWVHREKQTSSGELLAKLRYQDEIGSLYKTGDEYCGTGTTIGGICNLAKKNY